MHTYTRTHTHTDIHIRTHLRTHVQVFQMVSGLFATIGYNGGLGVIFSIPVFVSALFSFIVLLMKKDTNASLAFNDKMKPEQP